MGLLQKKRTETTHAAASEIAQAEGDRCTNEKRPERGVREKRSQTMTVASRRFARRFFASQERECDCPNHAEKTEFQHGHPPPRRLCAPPAVNRPKEKADARSHPQDSQRFARSHWIQPCDHRRGGRMIK